MTHNKTDGGDDNDNSNEETDTEFEDDLIVTAILNNSSAEETRISLENALGTKEFIKAYPLIEVLHLIYYWYCFKFLFLYDLI